LLLSAWGNIGCPEGLHSERSHACYQYPPFRLSDQAGQWRISFRHKAEKAFSHWMSRKAEARQGMPQSGTESGIRLQDSGFRKKKPQASSLKPQGYGSGKAASQQWQEWQRRSERSA
jgi:hypothetical protein